MKKNNHKKTDIRNKARPNHNESSVSTTLVPAPKPTLPSNGECASALTNNLASGMQRVCLNQSMTWEREFVGNFLLEMCKNQVINARSDWYVEKSKLRRLFLNHLNLMPNSIELRLVLATNGPLKIGSLLDRTNFLMNTPRGNPNYRIKSFSLMEFRKGKFNEIDERRKNCDLATCNDTGTAAKEQDRAIVEDYKLDMDSIAVQLKYQKTRLQHQCSEFNLSSLGCYICQCNFDSIDKYEEHIEYHSDESDFQSLEGMEKLAAPMFRVSYRTCVKSHYFGFTLETQLTNMVIEKFIIVQSRQFYYVHNGRLPLTVPANGQLVFFVDSHVFMLLREQPIVIGFSRIVDKETQHYIEQHHFMRTEALPKPLFAINPYRMSNEKRFQAKFRLDFAKPPPEVLKALKQDDAQQRLADYDKHYRKYCENGQLSQDNMYGTLKTLLQVEDIERLQRYVALKQSNMELHQFGRELSVKIRPNQRNISAEDVLSPFDDVLIINERVTAYVGKGNGAPNIYSVLNNNNLILEIALMDSDSTNKWAHSIDNRFGVLDSAKHEPRVYFARVLSVSATRVNITCERFLPDNTSYTLIFRPLRSVIRYQYRALKMLSLANHEQVRRFLFPDISHAAELYKCKSDLKLANDGIADNPEQLQAVKQIVFCEKLAAPYIIFGPPGTGKTATICEAIYQLFVRRPQTRVLVLAGSNTACDEIALRLLRYISKVPNVAKWPLTRVFSASSDRRIDNIDELLLEYSNMYALHFYPHIETVHQYRIVVCTLSLAGKLSLGGFARTDSGSSVFTHVFVDEAAASTEAEVLMGITCTIAANTNLVLSGDHKQLGPVLQSQRANEWGLSLTLFERLLQRECYQLDCHGDYNPAIQTRLLRNYRSHPQIVSLYNDLYYDSQLKAVAPLENVSLVKEWFHTSNPDFPILFHSVFGTSMSTRNSVSLCNNKEIDAVMDYVKDLMYFGINGTSVTQTDIGIISPYKNQYQRIQEQLNMRNWHKIDCGSVELFQGKEKQIIIVSFVRSFTPQLGFLDNRRRLNVLLSRPMSLLVMIGNPRTLSQNHDFRHIIEKCRAQKTLVGSPYTLELNQVDKLPSNKMPQQKTGSLLKLEVPTNNNKIAEIDKLLNELPAVPQDLVFEAKSDEQIKATKLVDIPNCLASTHNMHNLRGAQKNGKSTLDIEGNWKLTLHSNAFDTFDVPCFDPHIRKESFSSAAPETYVGENRNNSEVAIKSSTGVIRNIANVSQKSSLSSTSAVPIKTSYGKKKNNSDICIETSAGVIGNIATVSQLSSLPSTSTVTVKNCYGKNRPIFAASTRLPSSTVSYYDSRVPSIPSSFEVPVKTCVTDNRNNRSVSVRLRSSSDTYSNDCPIAYEHHHVKFPKAGKVEKKSSCVIL